MNERYYDMYAADDSHEHHRGRRGEDAIHSEHQYSRNSHSSGNEGSVYNDRSNPQNEQFYSRYNNDRDYYYDRPRPRSSTSFRLVRNVLWSTVDKSYALFADTILL